MKYQPGVFATKLESAQGMIDAEFYYARGVMRMNKAARRWGV